MTMTNMAKRTAAGTLALAVCIGGGALALAGSAQAATVASSDFAKPSAVVASGDGSHLVDSVTAGPFAATLGAGILLTPTDQMDANTYYYLTDSHVQVVYIVGGYAAVSKAVEERIHSYGITVYRLAGADRYATAKVIAETNDLAFSS